MKPHHIASAIASESATEIETAVQVVWFFQRVGKRPSVRFDDVFGFFDEHAISYPNRSRLRMRLFADERVLRDPQHNTMRLRASVMREFDTKFDVSDEPILLSTPFVEVLE